MSEKDKLKYELNVFTGELDLISEFNANRILTHEKNSSGNPLVMFDPISGTYVEMGPLIITDENGNVVVT